MIEKKDIEISQHALSVVVGALLGLAFCVFMLGYAWGKKAHIVQEEADSFLDTFLEAYQASASLARKNRWAESTHCATLEEAYKIESDYKALGIQVSREEKVSRSAHEEKRLYLVKTTGRKV